MAGNVNARRKKRLRQVPEDGCSRFLLTDGNHIRE
jgi:hypothetical protein